MGSAVVIILVAVEWRIVVAVNITDASATISIADIAVPGDKVIGQGVHSFCVSIVWLDKV